MMCTKMIEEDEQHRRDILGNYRTINQSATAVWIVYSQGLCLSHLSLRSSTPCFFFFVLNAASVWSSDVSLLLALRFNVVASDFRFLLFNILNTDPAFVRAPKDAWQRWGFTLWARDPVQSVGLVGRVPTFRRNILPPAEGSASESLVHSTSLCGDVARCQCEFHTWRLVEISFFGMKGIL